MTNNPDNLEENLDDFNNNLEDDFNNNLEDDFDDDFDEYIDEDGYEYYSFTAEAHEAMAPKIKQFLSDYYGDKMAELEAETYLDIEEIIKEAFEYDADMIPDLLYEHRGIPNDEFDAAMEAYVRTDKTFDWPRPEYWFDRAFGDEEEDEIETYLKESDPMDLTEEEILARNVIEAADNMIDGHASFADFTKKGFEILSKHMQQHMIDVAIFDLEVLTEKGFEELQDDIFWLITEMLDKLHGTIEADLSEKK